MYSLTIFKSAYDNKTHRRMDFASWEEFVVLLETLSRKPIRSKKYAPLISPAVYKKGTTRSNKNVIEWGHWACVDIDEGIESVGEILDRFKYSRCVVYSTASCSSEKIKLRVVFDLDRRIEVSEIKHFWYALNKSIGDLGDAQTKDSSRMYYVPATYDGAFNFIHVIDGNEPLCVDALIREHPYQEKTGNSFLDSLPEGVRESVLEHRKSSLTNTNVTWAGYRDCPFFPNKMAEEYKSVNETGWYLQMYRIMVATACNAVKYGYPITASQIAQMCQELDRETGNWYENRPLEREAGGALSWAYANAYNGDVNV